LLVEPEETEDPSWKGTTSCGYGRVDNFLTNCNESSPGRNISRSKRPIFLVDRYVPNAASGSVAIVDHKYRKTSWVQGGDRDFSKRKSRENSIVDRYDEDREQNRKPTKKSTIAYRDVSEGTNGKQHLSSSDNESTDLKVASQRTKTVECSHVSKGGPSCAAFGTLNDLSNEELKELGFKHDDTMKSAVPLEATETDDLSEKEKMGKSPVENPDDE